MNRFGQAWKWRFKRPLMHATAVFGGFSVFYTLFFAPVLFSRQLLAFGDGINYFLPAYYAPKTLWTDLLFGGYPIAADPQNMTWYPPALLLSWIPGSWNIFVMSGYVLAACFAYCYIYKLTASRLAGVVTGLTYSMSGFMVAHLTMIGMINAAAWIPLLICALEQLRHRVSRGWFVVGVVAFVCCFLGGHPQISVYGLGLGVFYTLFLGWQAPIGRWRYYRYAFGLMAIGVGICAIQLLPAAELSQLSLRSELTVGAFLNGSLPLWQSLQYIFPFLFGSGIALPPYTDPYWGREANMVEIATYMGILPLMLMAAGLSGWPRRGVIRFWLWVAMIAFVVIFGKYLFIGRLLYHVPIYNAFRVPARHGIELAMAVSVLTGFGVAAIQQQRVSVQRLRQIVFGSLLIMVVALGVIAIHVKPFQSRASQVGIENLTFWPWVNAAVGVPLVIFAAALLALVVWYRWPRTIVAVLALLTVLVLDLGSFGFWFHHWPNIGPDVAKLEAGPVTQKYRQLLEQNQTRLAVGSGIASHLTPDAVHPIFPNATRLWDLPLTGGYSPLMLKRVSEMIQVNNNGMLDEDATDVNDRGLDLMATQYLLAQQWQPGSHFFSNYPAAARYVAQVAGTARTQSELMWSEQKLPLTLSGGESLLSRESVRIDLPNIPGQTTAIAFVTALSQATDIPDNAPVVNVQVIDINGDAETHFLFAGRDTSEQTYDCPDVQPQMQHPRATVFQSISLDRPGGATCVAHSYQTEITLNQPRTLKRIRLYWNEPPGSMAVHHISLLDREGGTSLPLQVTPNRSTKWQVVERFPTGVMYENQQALPRAWVVPSVLPLAAEAILQTIHTSQLPNGEPYQPDRVALVESNDPALAALKTPSPLNSWKVQAAVSKSANAQVTVQTDAPAPAFLVLSDVNYPGWRAWVDGKPAQVFQTNYVQRGVLVPAGLHSVRFEYHPLSFRLGAGIAVAAIFGGSFWLWRMK